MPYSPQHNDLRTARDYLRHPLRLCLLHPLRRFFDELADRDRDYERERRRRNRYRRRCGQPPL